MRRIIFFLGTILGLTLKAFAQIQGDVTDPKDKGIPNAVIIVTDSARKTADTVKSDNRGFYSFTGLKPGKYKIEAKSTGFLPTVIKEIIVNEGDTGPVEGEEDYYKGTRLDITLNPAKVP